MEFDWDNDAFIQFTLNFPAVWVTRLVSGYIRRRKKGVVDYIKVPCSPLDFKYKFTEAVA